MEPTVDVRRFSAARDAAQQAAGLAAHLTAQGFSAVVRPDADGAVRVAVPAVQGARALEAARLFEGNAKADRMLASTERLEVYAYGVGVPAVVIAWCLVRLVGREASADERVGAWVVVGVMTAWLCVFAVRMRKRAG